MKAAKAEADRIAAIKNPTFEKDILPIFQKTCVECHGKDKQKNSYAELCLDTFAELQKGADGIPVFVEVGKIGESELHARVILPDSDDERMLPKGNRLSDPVADLIKRWIEQGAKQSKFAIRFQKLIRTRVTFNGCACFFIACVNLTRLSINQPLRRSF